MPMKKAVALIELTSPNYIGQNPIAVNYIKTFNYYWTKTPKFVTFEIVDNKSDVNYTVAKLEEYYNKGYRIFFGPLASSLVLDAYNHWFKFKPDAIGITPVAKTTQLSIPKNIYRLDPGNYNFLGYIYENIPSTTSRIFYVYTSEQIGTVDLLTMLHASSYEIIALAIPQNASNLTLESLLEYFNNNSITSNDIVITFFIGGIGQSKYVNLFSDSQLQHVPKQYDVSTKFPSINKLNPPTYLYYKYNVLILDGINTTELLTVGKNDLSNSYGINGLSSLYLITHLANNKSIDTISSCGESLLWFNENNDLKYWSYTNYLYSSSGFFETNIYSNDPNFGLITFNRTENMN